MTKVDFKKELKHLYKPTAKQVDFVEVPNMGFLMIDGEGDPNTSQDYADAVETLYALAYSVKFLIKKGEMSVDYGVMPLECLWWADDMNDFTAGNKDKWKWRAMIMQPDLVTPDVVEQAKEQVRLKKNPAALPKVKYETFAEGPTAQIMHIGPFTEEGPTIQRVHEAIKDAGHELSGKHHEIYLSDIRKAAPEKWRTIIRQPYK